MKGLAARLIDFLGGLVVSQGPKAGEPFKLMGWQKRFIRGAFAAGVSDAALSVARANGKTTLAAGVALAAIAGPLRQPRSEVVLVAASSEQAAILFEHVLAFGESAGLIDSSYRIQNNPQTRAITHKETNARVRVLSSDPKRAHGIAPALILADEPAQWPSNTSEKMLAALRTSRGKIAGARFIALGTRSHLPQHWFSKLLTGDRPNLYAQVHAADDLEAYGSRAQWRKANPSLSGMPELMKMLELESKDAEHDPGLMASFKALRLNGGVLDADDVDMLISPAVWRRCVDAPAADPHGPTAWGVDLGSSGAMSAVACVWPTGRIETLAMFGAEPALDERAHRDGAGEVYRIAQAAGELIVSDKRIPPVRDLLREAARRWGMPAKLACDRWRMDELRDALADDDLPWRQARLIPRGQGFRDGAEAVRAWEKATIAERVRPVKPATLLTWQLSEAVVMIDPAGNRKLATGSQAGRRRGLRDDVVAAALLGVEWGLPPLEDAASTRPQLQVVVA